jgi:hypothetical protein
VDTQIDAENLTPPLRVAAVSPSFGEHPVLRAELKQKFPDVKSTLG